MPVSSRALLRLFGAANVLAIALLGQALPFPGPGARSSGNLPAPIQQTISCPLVVATATCTFSSAPIAGHFLVFQGGNSDLTVSISGITSTGATWTKIKSSLPVNRDVEIWSTGALTGTPGTTVAIVFTAAPSNSSVNVSEWSGLATGGADGTPTTNSGTSNNPATLAVTTSVGGVVFAAAWHATTTLSSGPTNSFSALNTADSARFYPAYKILPPGTYSTDWTTGTSGVWDTVAAGIK